MTTREIQVHGGQLRVHVRAGRIPTLVFLHYWGGSHRTWSPVIDRLDPDIGVVAYDQRGWGEARDVPGPFDLVQLADDAQSVIGTLGLTDYVLVGHSMGGKVAQLVAARRPSGLAGVVLIAPAPPAPAPLTADDQNALAHAYDGAESVNLAIDHVLTAGGLGAGLRSRVVEDSLSAHAPARDEWPLRGIVSDIRDTVASIDVPVLVLAGDEDRVEPLELLKSHLTPYLLTSTFTVLDGTGHLSPLEVPEQVAAHLEGFLGRR